jgi:hypothetical protein
VVRDALADRAPGRLSAVDRAWDVPEVYRALEGLAEILRIIGATDHEHLDTDFPAMCVFLANSVRDYAAQLGAAAGGWITDDAVVTIAPAASAPKAVAS